MTTVRGVYLKILISGYVREIEKNLFMNVPDGICRIMHDLFPLLAFTFGDFKTDEFKIDEDRMKLKGGDNESDVSCWGHLVYADLEHFNDDGLNKGVHYWSVKAIIKAGCFACIGVTTQKNHKLINEWAFDGHRCSHYRWIKNGHNSHYDISGEWDKDAVITLRLDCDAWSVTYYVGTDEIRKDNIKPNQSYYLALMVCNESEWTHLKIVETPQKLLIQTAF